MIRPSGGSSPLSRGIQVAADVDLVGDRIIPALAGNTGCLDAAAQWHGDHPRSRGEYSISPALISSATGSSPLSRGIHGSTFLFWAGVGIIPALAGNTSPSQMVPIWTGDHPRSRGEYRPLRQGAGRHRGSSPLSRGIPGRGGGGGIPARIIPALAGNTPSARPTREVSPDHPRSRGEYALRGRQNRFWGGSSPLSRGILRP